MEDLRGKVAIVTGCNRGIGKAILEELAEKGASVFAVTRKEDPAFIQFCMQLQEKYDIKIWNIYGDFSGKENVISAAKQIISYKQPIDILVNNIGIGNPECMLQMIKEADFRNVFEVNFFSAIWLTQSISRVMMRQKKGSIVFVSSSAAYDGGANVDYSASKAALLGAVKRLAIELGEFGIRVNAVAPSLTDTDMGNSMTEEDEKKALSMNIMHRKGTTREIANAVLFLASDRSSFITAQTIRVDGGLL